MKNIVYQLYNEGFATLFYLKPVNYIKRNIKSKSLIKILSFIIKLIYTILIIGLVIVMVYFKYF